MTALSWKRHESAQMISKPAAIPGTCGARKASAPATAVATRSGHSRLRTVGHGRSSGIVVAARASASARAIGGVVEDWRPRRAPTTAATSHQATAWSATLEPGSFAAPTTHAAASAVAAPALSSTVVRSRSAKRIRSSGRGGDRSPGSLGARARITARFGNRLAAPEATRDVQRADARLRSRATSGIHDPAPKPTHLFSREP